ncbi:lysozyme [Roseibium sediminis]|uniref:lysozyme n=1 Tax=Roseibium sediminis TaxID=1775174 RepID=UPI00123D8E48|nr:lysozyme [Roseibium sediminis]
MANLARYSGTRNLPGVRQAQVIADTSQGEAMASLGAQVQRSAGALGQVAALAQQRQNEIDDFERKRGLLDFTSNVSQREFEASNNLAPGASGYTENMLAQFDKDASDFVSKLPESQRAQAELDVKGLRGQFFGRFSQTEYNERQRYFQQGIAEGQDTLAKTIRSNPNAYEEAREHGRALISESGLSKIQKEAALKQWDRMASLAWVDTLPATERQQLFAGSNVDAASLIRSKEGFRNNAYWDVNHYRTGYGSDTVTKADGTIVKVTKDTVVTREDAERDLNRRIGEFQAVAVKQIGANAWQALPPRAQAALTSITYNYGELPTRLHAAVKSGDMEALAIAIEGLKGDNSGVNSNRRQEEADIVRGARRIPNAPPEVQARIDALSYDDQVKLSDQAQRDMITIASDRKDAFALDIANDPLTVDRQQILTDPMLDNGQKATLINSLDSALKETEKLRSAVTWAQTEGKSNPLDPDARKDAQRVWNSLVEGHENPDQLAVDIVERKGVVPKPYVDMIRNNLRSSNPATAGAAFASAMRLYEIDPLAVRGAENGQALEDAALKWRVYRESLGLSEEDAGARLAAQNSPEYAAARKQAQSDPELGKAIKGATAEFIESELSGWFSGVALGGEPIQTSRGVAEYREILEEAWIETGGDKGAATALANERFLKTWGTSEFNRFGADVLVKYPLEQVVPAVGGSHEYVHEQIQEDFAAEGIEFDDYHLSALIGPSGENLTLEDIRAGRPVRYSLSYTKDGRSEVAQFPFYADPEAANAKRLQALQEEHALSSKAQEKENTLAESRRNYRDALTALSVQNTPENQKRLEDAKAKIAPAEAQAAEAKKAVDAVKRPKNATPVTGRPSKTQTVYEQNEKAVSEFEALEMAQAALERGDNKEALRAVRGFPSLYRDIEAYIRGQK